MTAITLEKRFSLPVIHLAVEDNGRMNLSSSEIIRRFPLRITVTDYCNAGCVFCSNDGMGERRNGVHVDSDKFTYLINILAQKGVNHISLSGGDPTMHPEICELVEVVNRTGVKKRFFHTNGILLGRPGLVDGLREFTKIGVSVHALDPELYYRIVRAKVGSYEKVIDNLRMLREEGLATKVEVKHVPMKGINDSPEVIKRTLEYCAENGFRFKILNLEPIKAEDLPLREDIDVIRQRVLELGAIPLGDTSFRGQVNYLPITSYQYKGVRGTVIEIGCGKPKVCASCFESNEICLTPELGIKSCNTNPYTIPLNDLIEVKDGNGIVKRIVASRKFLATMPGVNIEYWSQQT